MNLRTKWAVQVAAAAVALATAACSGSSSPPTASTDGGSSSATSRSGSPAEPVVALPGIGDSRSHWDATHDAVKGFAKGAVYGPMIGSQPTYSTVFGDDYIDTYTVNFLPNTTLQAAYDQVHRQELPPGSEETSRRLNLDTCAILAFASTRLEEVHPGDEVSVSFFTTGGGPLNGDHVDFAVLLLVPKGTTKGQRC